MMGFGSGTPWIRPACGCDNRTDVPSSRELAQRGGVERAPRAGVPDGAACSGRAITVFRSEAAGVT